MVDRLYLPRYCVSQCVHFLVDCRLLLYEDEEEERTIWPVFTGNVPSTGRREHAQDIPRIQKGPRPSQHRPSAKSFAKRRLGEREKERERVRERLRESKRESERARERERERESKSRVRVREREK